MTGTVRLGLVGAGNVGKYHLKMLAGIHDMEVVAVTDVVAAAAESAASGYGIASVCRDVEELVSADIDAVMVCTPTAMHAAPTLAALAAGKHVFVEKPIAATFADASAMVSAARAVDRMLMVGLKVRFSPEIAAARSIIASGALGTVHYAEAVSDRRRGVPGGSFIRRSLAGFGVCADLGVYPLDAVLHLLGGPRPLSVSAVVSNALSRAAGPVQGQWADDRETRDAMDVEDFAAAWVRLEGGATLLLKTSWAQHLDTLGGTFLLGDKGGLRIGVHEVAGPKGLTLFRDEFGTMTEVRPVIAPEVDNAGLFRRELEAFGAAVRDNLPSPVDTDEVLAGIAVIDAAMRSAADGGRETAVSLA
jgi:predicted dehydrogenase